MIYALQERTQIMPYEFSSWRVLGMHLKPKVLRKSGITVEHPLNEPLCAISAFRDTITQVIVETDKGRDAVLDNEGAEGVKIPDDLKVQIWEDGLCHIRWDPFVIQEQCDKGHLNASALAF